MWWVLTLLGMTAAAISFIGVLVGMFKHNHLLIKRGIIGFVVSFIIAFVSVGIAGIGI